MRRAYTYIIVGFFFIFLSITINEIDLLKKIKKKPTIIYV